MIAVPAFVITETDMKTGKCTNLRNLPSLENENTSVPLKINNQSRGQLSYIGVILIWF